MSRDPALLASTFMANVAFLGMSWKQMLGRPTITLLVTQYLLGKLNAGALALLRGTSWYFMLSVQTGLPRASRQFFLVHKYLRSVVNLLKLTWLYAQNGES